MKRLNRYQEPLQYIKKKEKKKKKDTNVILIGHSLLLPVQRNSSSTYYVISKQGYVWLIFFVLCFSNLYLDGLRNCSQEHYLDSFEKKKIVWYVFHVLFEQFFYLLLLLVFANQPSENIVLPLACHCPRREDPVEITGKPTSNPKPRSHPTTHFKPTINHQITPKTKNPEPSPTNGDPSRPTAPKTQNPEPSPTTATHHEPPHQKPTTHSQKIHTHQHQQYPTPINTIRNKIQQKQQIHKKTQNQATVRRYTSPSTMTKSWRREREVRGSSLLSERERGEQKRERACAITVEERDFVLK